MYCRRGLPHPIIESSIVAVQELEHLLGGPLTKEHGIYKFMAKLIPLRLGFEQDGEEFDFMKWIEEGGLDGINIAKL